MRLRFPLLAGAVCLTQSLFADSSSIIKQKAKDLSNQNNARQGQIAPAPAQPPPAANTVPAPPPQSPALTRLQSTLGSFKADDAQEKLTLAQDLVALSDASQKPSADAARTLADDLAAAFAQKPLPKDKSARFALELDALLNPSKYPKAKPDGILTDMQAMFLENGLPRKDAVKLVDDVKAFVGKKST